MRITAVWNRTRAPYVNGKSFVNVTMDKSIKATGEKVLQWLKAHDCCDEVRRTNQLIVSCKNLRQACAFHSENYLKDIKETKRQAVQAHVNTQLEKLESYIISLANMRDLSLERDLALEKTMLQSDNDRSTFLAGLKYATDKLKLDKADARKFAIKVAQMKSKGASYIKDFETFRSYAIDPFKVGLSLAGARQFAFELAERGLLYLDKYKQAYHFASDHFGLNLSSAKACEFAAQAAELEPEYLENFKSCYKYALDHFGLGIPPAKARQFAQQTANFGPEYLKNHKPAYKYATDFFGLRLSPNQARKFANETAKLGPEYLAVFKKTYGEVNGNLNGYSEVARQYADSYARKHAGKSQHSQNSTEREQAKPEKPANQSRPKTQRDENSHTRNHNPFSCDTGSQNPEHQTIQQIKDKIPNGFKNFDPAMHQNELIQLEKFLQTVSNKQIDGDSRSKLFNSVRDIVYDDTTNENMTKAYRKLALKLHPDKNTHPMATVAFKIAQEVYDLVTDVEHQRNININVGR